MPTGMAAGRHGSASPVGKTMGLRITTTGFLLFAAATAAAQNVTASDPVLPPGVIGPAAGTGRWAAIAEARADAPGYTIYRPRALSNRALPLVLWGNGGCRD